MREKEEEEILHQLIRSFIFIDILLSSTLLFTPHLLLLMLLHINISFHSYTPVLGKRYSFKLIKSCFDDGCQTSITMQLSLAFWVILKRNKYYTIINCVTPKETSELKLPSHPSNFTTYHSQRWKLPPVVTISLIFQCYLFAFSVI